MRLIDADELIFFGFDNPDCDNLFEFVPKEFIDNAPTADVLQWIPCSERLPEKPKPNDEFEGKPLDIYLVCKKGNIPFRAFWNGKNFTDGWTSLNVDAWMPLPEPWKGEEDD